MFSDHFVKMSPIVQNKHKFPSLITFLINVFLVQKKDTEKRKRRNRQIFFPRAGKPPTMTCFPCPANS